MAITDISISEELQTNAPSIKYRGNEGPKSPQEMEMMMETSVDDPFYRGGDEDEHSFRMFNKPYKELNADELEEFREEMMRLMNKFSGGENNRVRELLLKEETEGLSEDEKEELRELIKTISAQGPVLPSAEDPINPFGPKPTGPVLPDRQMAAYGGIMGMDGRKQYGIGSFFQRAKDKFVDDIIPNEIKDNPLLTGALIAGGADLTRGDNSLIRKGLGSVTDFLLGKQQYGDTDMEPLGREGGLFKKVSNIKTGDNRTLGGDIAGSIAKNIVPIVGGISAGLFTKNTDSDTPGLPSDDTALNLAEYKKAANLLDQKQGLAADMNFLPTVASRKYSPEEMAITYAQAAATGGRIGFNQGLLAGPSPEQSMKPSPGLEDVEDRSFKFDSEQFMIDQYNKEGVQPEIIGEGFDGQSFVIRTPNGGSMIISLEDFTTNFGKPPMKAKGIERGADDQPYRYKTGGRIGMAEGGIMDLGGMEKDYRAEGGFVPIGREEKADDVPARLSVNEFVFTADAVRNAGGGDIDQGAKVMENMMKHLEAGGQVSEESQGMAGARDMFEVSERLSEVV